MAEIIGTIALSYTHDLPGYENEKGKKSCICCPGHPSHIYSLDFNLDPHESRFPKHFGTNLDQWLMSMFDFYGMQGKRIRITAEVVEE